MNSDVKIFADKEILEESCKEQIEKISNSEAYKDCKIRIMPDAHTGVSSCIGFTCAYKNKVVPATIGVDISCGMYLIKLEGIKEENIDFKKLDEFVKTHIPTGRNIHDAKIVSLPEITHLRCFRELKDTPKFEKALGSLGGG